MAAFEPAFDLILQHEGVDADDPADAGGRTRYGVSQSAYPDLDIASLTLADAKAIYRRDYWDRLRLGAVRHQQIAEYLLDVGVNQGVYTAAHIAQRACNYYGSRLTEDGIIGPKTLAVLNAVPREKLLPAMVAQRGAHYIRLVQSRHQNARFAWGWMRRAFYPYL